MLKVQAVLVPVYNTSGDLEDLEYFDEATIPNVGAANEEHSVLFSHVLEYFCPHQEICFGKVQLAQILGVVHMEHPDINVCGPADSVVVGLIEDVDFLLAQNGVNDTHKGSEEPMNVKDQVLYNPTDQDANNYQICVFEIHGMYWEQVISRLV